MDLLVIVKAHLHELWFWIPIFQPQMVLHRSRTWFVVIVRPRDQRTVNLLEPSLSGPWKSPIYDDRTHFPFILYVASYMFPDESDYCEKRPLALVTFSVKLLSIKNLTRNCWQFDWLISSLVSQTFSWNFQVAHTRCLDTRTQELWKKRKNVFVQNQIACDWIV